MGTAFIVRRGGGGLSKCSVIVHIEHGSTVAAYSDAAATAIVKVGKEIGTSGDYLITGLDIGTYYIKAEKETRTRISTAVTFTAYGIKYIPLLYEFVIFRDGVANPALGELSGSTISTDGDITAIKTDAPSPPPGQGRKETTGKFENPFNITEYKTLHIIARYYIHDGSTRTYEVGIGITNGDRTYKIPLSSSYAEQTINLEELTGTDYYISFFADCQTYTGGTQGGSTVYVKEAWMD